MDRFEQIECVQFASCFSIRYLLQDKILKSLPKTYHFRTSSLRQVPRHCRHTLYLRIMTNASYNKQYIQVSLNYYLFCLWSSAMVTRLDALPTFLDLNIFNTKTAPSYERFLKHCNDWQKRHLTEVEINSAIIVTVTPTK